jgi:hypothetical protein
MWEKLVLISVLAVFSTLLFFNIPNKSNFPKKYIIPIIVSLIIKYSLGDLDKGYNYTICDVYYWFMILFIPYAVVLYLEQ